MLVQLSSVVSKITCVSVIPNCSTLQLTVLRIAQCTADKIKLRHRMITNSIQITAAASIFGSTPFWCEPTSISLSACAWLSAAC